MQLFGGKRQPTEPAISVAELVEAITTPVIGRFTDALVPVLVAAILLAGALAGLLSGLLVAALTS